MAKIEEDQELNDKQLLFCKEYLIDLNRTQAAIRAGYSENSARQMGSENLSKPYIQDKIFELAKDRMQRLEMQGDDVVRELVKIASSDVRRLFDENGCLLPVNEWPDVVAVTVSSVEVEELFEGQGAQRKLIGYTKKVKFWDKTKSLDLLGKHLRIFLDRLELSGDKDKPLMIEHSMMTEEQVKERIQVLLEKRKAKELS